MSLPRLALLADYTEEGWPSMDLCSEMLGRHLIAEQAQHLKAMPFCPPYKHRLGRVPGLGNRRISNNADRLFNRLFAYPRALRRQRGAFNLFHVCDHSYAHLVHRLPAKRTGVYCHDLDTFRCILHPEQERRPRWFRAMARYILRGMQKAAVVFHSTEAVRREILECGLIDPHRLVHAPYGTSAEFQLTKVDPDPAAKFLHVLEGRPFLMHVGSCIPRKRIDVLLEVFAAVRTRSPDLRLVKIGGDWTPEQRDQIMQRGLESSLHHWQGLDRSQLASLYRQASVVLQPSDKEGFGLPVIEALACGAPVVASDIPPLREVGGNAIVYAPAGAVARWVEVVGDLLARRTGIPGLAERLIQADKFSWRHHASIIAEAYVGLAQATAESGAATI